MKGATIHLENIRRALRLLRGEVMKKKRACCYLYFGRFSCWRRPEYQISWAEPGKAPYDCYTDSCSQHLGALMPVGCGPATVTSLLVYGELGEAAAL